MRCGKSLRGVSDLDMAGSGGEGRDNQGRDRGREPKKSVTLRSVCARGGGGIGLERGRDKLPTYLSPLLVQELKNVQDVRVDASKDILIHPMLGSIDSA